MAFVVKDRVKVTTTTTGTGTLTLGSAAVGGFQDFSVIGDGNTTYYAITDSGASAFEVGIGIFTSSGTTLSRDTVLESSNAGALVDFAAGTKDVFVTYPAERAVIGGMGYIENSSSITVSSTINVGNNAMSSGPVTIADGVSVTVPDGSRWVVV
jgi:hypothetical protein